VGARRTACRARPKLHCRAPRAPRSLSHEALHAAGAGFGPCVVLAVALTAVTRSAIARSPWPSTFLLVGTLFCSVRAWSVPVSWACFLALLLQLQHSSMLCYAVLCYALPCLAMLCWCYSYAMLCRMLCYSMLCYAMLCYAMLCYAMLCYAMLCYVMLCYAMLCYARAGCSAPP
jgi:hypothetical protein